MAPCGLYCGTCGVYIATRDDNSKFKAILGNLYGTKPEETECLGCMQTDPAHPAAAAVLEAVEAAAGEAPIVVPSFGSSVPLHHLEALGAPAVIVPMANHDNNQHGANENLRLQNLWDGIEIYAAALTGL